MKLRIILFSLLLIPSFLSAQQPDQITFFGIEYKPIFSSRFFTTGPQLGFEDSLSYSVTNYSGSSFGMVVRHNFYGKFSFETGINIITRNYSLELSEDTSNFFVQDTFKLVSYEIPLLGLVYVQSGERTFINAGGGLSINFLPSELESGKPQVYQQLTRRSAWVSASLLAQLGFEYRTKESGIFYIGASYHLPFSALASSRAVRIKEGNKPRVSADLNGRFLTMSLRYFFGPSPAEKTASQL